jgi:hypothetical protein
MRTGSLQPSTSRRSPSLIPAIDTASDSPDGLKMRNNFIGAIQARSCDGESGGETCDEGLGGCSTMCAASPPTS